MTANSDVAAWRSSQSARRVSATDVAVVAAMVVFFAAAVVLRVVIAGPAGPYSASAGLCFGAVLAIAAVVARTHTRVDVRGIVAGVAGTVVLCAPVVVFRTLSVGGAHRPAGHYAGWAVVVCTVALAEEAFLRGALYGALEVVGGPWLAVLGGALCFALLHVPFYGWRAGAFDLAVGCLLGTLRWLTGSWIAPGVAHAGADLAAWWLR